MSSSRDDHYYPSVGKSRRSSPGDSQAGVYYSTGHSAFQSGPGRPTVLPPLSAAFPTSLFPVPSYSNPYSLPRSSPARNDHASSLHGQWHNNPPHQSASSFQYYEHHDPRYQQATSYSSSYASQRTTPTLPSEPHSSRRLPPLSVPQTSDKAERWPASSYPPSTFMHNICSPTASYPPEFAPYPPNSYSHQAAGDPRGAHHGFSSMTHSQMSQAPPPSSSYSDRQHREPSPYSRGHTEVSPPLSSPNSEEPTIKKKRKRADANQLRILNDTYNRTAFPSTEERAELAKALDMSARSVQIWFQNKRQSMRATSRQSSSSQAHHPFALSSHTGDAAMLEDISPSSHGSSGSGGYGTIHHEVPFTGVGHGRSSRGSTRHTSQSPPPLPPPPPSSSSSSHRRGRTDDEGDSRKWSSRGY